MADLSIELWAVTETDISGVTSVVITSSRDEAVSHFMLMAYLFLHAAPDSNFVVVGDDNDAALTGLHLIWKGGEMSISFASVTRPASISSKPGYVPYETGDTSFVDLAKEMNAAIAQNHGRLDPQEIERLKHSAAAMALGAPLAKSLLDSEESEKKISQAKAKRMWSAMKSVQQYISMTATICN